MRLMGRTSAGDRLVGWSSVGAAHAARRHTHVGTESVASPTAQQNFQPFPRIPGRASGKKRRRVERFARPAAAQRPTDLPTKKTRAHALTQARTRRTTDRDRQTDLTRSDVSPGWLAGHPPQPTHTKMPPKGPNNKTGRCAWKRRPVRFPLLPRARSIEKRPKRKGQSKRRSADPKNPPRRPRARREKGSMEGPEAMSIRMWA